MVTMTRLQIPWAIFAAIITFPFLGIKLVSGERVLIVILTGIGYGNLPPPADVDHLANPTLA